MNRNTKLVILFLILIIATILCLDFFAMSNLHYWYVGKDGFGLMFSIGSFVIRLGQTP